MTTPIEYVRDRYEQDDHRDPTYSILVGSNDGSVWLPLTGILDVEFNFSVGRVPSGRIHTTNIRAPDVKAFASFFKRIVVAEGFDGVNVVQFVGRILDINEDERYLEITFQGTSWPLDVQFHIVIETFDNVENNASMAGILDQAGIIDYSVSMPTWQIGTVAPQVLEFQTYGEALQKVADVGGGAWWETPGGILIVRDVYVLDHFNTSAGAVGTYWRGVLVGPVESAPPGCSGRPRLLSWHRTNDVRQTFNGAYVTGCQVTQFNADGSSDNIDIFAYSQAASGYVLNPDGSQAYNVKEWGNELIDEIAKAQSEADRIVNFENGMHETFSITIPGDPTLALMQNRRIVDPVKELDRYAIVVGYTTRMSGRGQYGSQVDLLFIDSADAAHVAPYALFHHVTMLEVKGDAPKALVACDGSASLSPDSPITNYEFVDNQTPHIINQSGASPLATGLYDVATIVAPLKVTLTVTDAFGETGTITLTIPYQAPSVGVVIPNIWQAGEWFLSRTLDGSQAWQDENEAASVISVSAIPGISSFVISSAGALYGTNDGRLYSVVAGVTTLVLSGLGKIVHLWYDLVDFDRVWMLMEDGRLYRAGGLGLSGFNWELWDDLRVVYAVPSMVCSRIATPGAGGVWIYGGHGGPLIMVDPAKNHAWI